MGTGVAESRDRVVVEHQLATDVEVVVRVVEEGPVEEGTAFVLEQQVVGQLRGRQPPGPGPGGDALRRVGLVVGRRPQLVDSLEVEEQVPPASGCFLGEDAAAEVRVLA